MIQEIRESRKLKVGGGAELTEAAMNEAESFVASLRLNSKTALRMRLLTEEIIEMVKSMAGVFDGLFWLEAGGGECRVRIEGRADMDVDKEKDLVSASSTGRNASVKGFTAKIANFIRHHKEYLGNLADAGAVFDGDYLYIGAMDFGLDMAETVWSLQGYRSYLEDSAHGTVQVEEDRDELEKSIVGNLADDVRIGVKGDDISITVIKKI